MNVFHFLLLLFLVVCAVASSFSKNLLNTILIYMSYSLVMSIIWICLESPDLAITEAAVGAGVTSVLFFVTLKKIRAIDMKDESPREKRERIVREQEAATALSAAENSVEAQSSMEAGKEVFATGTETAQKKHVRLTGEGQEEK